MLRPNFTKILLQKLLRGNSINVYGAIGQGQARLLEDLMLLAQEERLLVLRVNMKSFARNYKLMISSLKAQLSALFPDNKISCTNFSEVMEALDEHAKTTKVLLMLENFDAVLDKPTPSEFVDFLTNLNMLKSGQPRILLLALTTKPYNQYRFYVKRIQHVSPLTLNAEELNKLSLRGIEAELKHREVSLNSRDFNLLKKHIYEHPRTFDFLEYCSGRLNAEDNQHLSLSERLKIWKKGFKRTYRKTTRMWLDELRDWILIVFFEIFEWVSTFTLLGKLLTKLSPILDKIKQLISR